jgi:hypothetical protein
MAKQVVTTAMMKCTFGAAPSSFIATPRPIQSSYQIAGNIMDHKPIANIPPFGVCSCAANPVVASATAAALGVLTPMPCVPNTPAPWIAGAPTVILDKFPALNDTSKLMCIWGGVITFQSPGQTTEDIP